MVDVILLKATCSTDHDEIVLLSCFSVLVAVALVDIILKLISRLPPPHTMWKSVLTSC